MYAVLHVPNFALQSMLRTEDGAQAQPAALFAENTKKSVALELNRPAQDAGVELGMTAPQAIARCPALLIRTPNVAAETDARAALHAVGFTISPNIEGTAPGVCTIDLKGSNAGAYQRAARGAVAQLEALGFIASAGIGETPLLALYAARAAIDLRRSKFICDPNAAAAAQSIADKSAPTGLAPQTAEAQAPYGAVSCGRGAPTPQVLTNETSVLHITDPESFLAPLPLTSADPSPAIATVLADWGLRTFGDLTALPRDDIGQRLGPEGLALWDRARGGAPRPINPITPPQTFAAAMDFEEEIETLEPLLFILRRFLERLTLELRTSGYVAVELELTLKLADDTQHRRPFRLPDPTADIDILFRALHTHLESLRTEASIAGVSLQIIPTRPLVRQQGLFETGLRDPHGFSETMARVAAIVGSDRVGTPVLEDTHRPDAVKLVIPPAVIPPPTPTTIHPPRGLPLRRFRPPLRAQLELVDGKPTYLWTERFHGTITEVRGPWLTSGEWWQADRAWRRTEYDIALENGGIYRLVLSDRQWFVEGEYD